MADTQTTEMLGKTDESTYKKIEQKFGTYKDTVTEDKDPNGVKNVYSSLPQGTDPSPFTIKGGGK